MENIRSRTASVMICALLAFSVAQAGPSGGDFEIVNSTMDSGGGISSGGDFVLVGTIGQPDATLVDSTGGAFKMAGGFWAKVRELIDLIFEDGFES